MSNTLVYKRWIVTGLLASTVVALASPAFADHRRYKGVQSSSPAQRVYVRQHSSNVGPVLAGLVGGFILGAAVTSNAHPVVVQDDRYDSRPAYRYYDPYGEDWYDSLDQCDFRYANAPRVVFVIDVRTGHRMRALRYNHGRWNRCEESEFSYWDGGHRSRDGDVRYRQRDDDRRYRQGDEDRRYRSRDEDSRRYEGGDSDN